VTVRVEADGERDGIVLVDAARLVAPLQWLAPDAYTNGRVAIRFVDGGLELTANRALATPFERI
jgi:hypothetical protein